jgi:hypothetical protein
MCFFLSQVSPICEAVDQFADFYADEDLVTMACLFAAAVHDYEHLGLSSEFFVKTGHARALRYKNEHVNEYHHVAAAFALLLRPEYNFLSSLPSAVFRHLRGMVAELVIATDMKENAKLVDMFKAILMSSSMQVSADRHVTLPAFAPATEVIRCCSSCLRLCRASTRSSRLQRRPRTQFGLSSG